MRKRLPGSKRRAAFTYIEFVIIVAILVVVATLLIPAVQSAQATAKSLTCLNNLKQIGVALQNYHDTHSTFPAPWTLDWSFDDFVAPSDNLNAHSWGQAILPYLGKSDLFDSIDMTHPSVDATTITNLNATLGTTFNPAIGQASVTANSQHVSVFNCPSVPGGPRIDPFSISGSHPALGLPFDLNYTIASSDYYTANGVQCEFYSGCGLGLPGFYTGPPQALRDGLMAHLNEANSKSKATDGLSQTFLIVERAGANDVYRVDTKIHDGGDGPFVDLVNDQYQAGGGWGDALNGEFWPAGALEDGTSPAGNGPCLINCTNVDSRGLYSFHPGGVNVLMADGSAHFINESIHTDIVCQLFSRAGGTGVGGF